ncbi:uncharacterized protein KD926_001320 [Aspergillus affinis]|uniref:uncharacterized protein n=1 Tax=Aspergillus affinis TaxID=1070780 RepID=UPI0022FDB9DF|nr:uncharacterized protein KD926_001320 [Aspergillus affinis]KAI9036798.1 hypothetical protein KD926_001320 [Aspergillus affinis]
MATVQNPESALPQLSTHLPHGLSQNGGRVDLSQLGFLRPTLPSLPVVEMRRRLKEDGYIFVKGVIPREDVLDARENYFQAYADTSLLQWKTQFCSGICHHLIGRFSRPLGYITRVLVYPQQEYEDTLQKIEVATVNRLMENGEYSEMRFNSLSAYL